jgi:hypothetical protein
MTQGLDRAMELIKVPKSAEETEHLRSGLVHLRGVLENMLTAQCVCCGQDECACCGPNETPDDHVFDRAVSQGISSSRSEAEQQPRTQEDNSVAIDDPQNNNNGQLVAQNEGPSISQPERKECTIRELTAREDLEQVSQNQDVTQDDTDLVEMKCKETSRKFVPTEDIKGMVMYDTVTFRCDQESGKYIHADGTTETYTCVTAEDHCGKPKIEVISDDQDSTLVDYEQPCKEFSCVVKCPGDSPTTGPVSFTTINCEVSGRWSANLKCDSPPSP